MENKKKILVLLKIFKNDLNPFDECALETALRIPDSEITVLSMSPLAYKDALLSLTRVGCNAVLVSDQAYALSDTVATANILAAAIKLLNPDVVFAGRQSVDGDTGQVPMMLSELLGFELVKKVINEEDGILFLRDGKQTSIKTKQIITFEKFRLLRSPSIFSKTSDVRIIDNNELKLFANRIGQPGSRTKVVSTFQNNEDRRFCKFIEYRDLKDVIAKAIKANNVQLNEPKTKINEVYYVGDIEKVAKKYAKSIKHLAIENCDVNEAIENIKKVNPKIILWEENEKIKELACRVAIKMDVGLCADCTNFQLLDGEIVITRPALSGDVMANIVCTSAISMATVRKDNNECDVAITVGRGAIEYIENIKKLAKEVNAEIYCSRPIADSGLMEYSRQVGLTGIMIKPKVCIAIGVSGAVQHIVGINKSQTIIAINSNKKEQIFDYADYGIVMDAKDI